MSDRFELDFDAKVKEADDIDIKEYSFSPTLLENGVIDYSNIEHDKIFLVNKHDILEKERPGWIPKLDIPGLLEDDFLPTTIKSSDGYYYVQTKEYVGMETNERTKVLEKKFETQIYKMSSDILAATVDYYIKKQRAVNKKLGIKKTVSLPRKTKSMLTTRYNNMVELLRFIPEYKDNDELLRKYPNRSKSTAYRNQNTIIFNQYNELLSVLKGKTLDLNLAKQDFINAYAKGEITSYGDTGLSNSLYEDFGVRIKKQNGSTFTLEQKERLKETLKYVHTYYGDLSNISKDFHLKVSYADNCNQHARKAIGLFTPYHNAIGVSFFDDNNYERTTTVHEFAHFLDYTKGNEFSYRYASDKDGTIENKIAEKYKKLIREENERQKDSTKLGDYWYRTCECFARAMEQDFELTIGLKERCNPPVYLPEEIFNKEIKPLIEELKKENEIKLNLISGKFGTWTTKIKNKINEQEMSDREKNNLIWLEEVHGCDKEKTAIVLHKLYEKFSESEAFERSKVLPTVFGKLRKQSESFELDFNDSSINEEELDTVLGIYDENITYHTVLGREWAVRHGMSKKEAAHLLEWDYSKAAEHKFIEIINKEELKEQEKENMSDVFDNKIENDEEYANELADWIIQESLECSVNKENYHISFEDIVEKTNTPIEWLNKNYKLVNEALAKHNDNELLEYNPEESNENEFNLNFCSNATENDENTLFKQNKQGRWVRKTAEELEQELKNNTKTIEIDSIFQTVSKEFNEKNKDFFNFYEEKKSEQIENLSKNISNIKEKMLFSKIHSEMLKIRVEELKEMVKRCPNKDIALAVGIRYFNYFGNIEGNISHQNIYTRFGIGHYEKDQMVYPTPEELKSFISKLYENSKTQETYMWIHNKDGSGCLKAPNGEKYFQYDPDANEVKITEDSTWIRREELNLGDKTFTQYAEDYVLENNAATYISFETNGKNIEKVQNVDESKQYSFFVKDTAEFEMYEEFETITGLTAKEAISEYKKLREDGLAAGIGINIPSDTTFDDPKGLGTTILVRENGIDTFDIYGDSFIVDLKENNERSQNRIAAYKELYEELQRAGLNVKEPYFVFDKHLELNNNIDDLAEISIYRNKIFQINWLVKTLNISSETADMFYKNYTVYDTVGKNYPDWNYEKNTITIFEERNNKLDYYEVSPLEICEMALKHAKNKEEIETIKTVMSKQNSLEKETISVANIKLNNITKYENGFYNADLFIPDENFIKDSSISNERFAMAVATWKDQESNINLSIVKRLISEPHNKEKEYLDGGFNGNPTIMSEQKWNLLREQETFDIIGEQIEHYFEIPELKRNEIATLLQIELNQSKITEKEIINRVEKGKNLVKSYFFEHWKDDKEKGVFDLWATHDAMRYVGFNLEIQNYENGKYVDVYNQEEKKELEKINQTMKNLLNEYSSELIERMNNNSNKFLFIFEKLQAAGIEVVFDKNEFNRILEREELLQKMFGNLPSKLSKNIKDVLADSLNQIAEKFIPTVYSRENFKKIFEDREIQTPIETVVIGDGQFVKLCPANRNNLMLAIKQTLENPSIVLEKETFDEKSESFKPVHVYGKSFINTNKHTKTVESIIIFKSNEQIVISMHPKPIEKFLKQIITADQIIYLDKEVSRVAALNTNAKDNYVLKEIQEFLSSSEQKFLPINPLYKKEFSLSTEKNIEIFIKEKNIELGNLKIDQNNFDKYFNIFNRHDDYINNKDKIASELFNYHVSDENKEEMKHWLADEGYSIKEKKGNQFMLISDGTIYGFAHENKIYLNPDIVSSEAALHEYTHLWDNYTKVTNPELWNKGKEVFKNTYLWEEVKNDEHYQDISHDEDLILSECHARITGKIADQILDKILIENGELTKDSVIDWNKEVFEYISKEFVGKDIDIQSVSEFVSQTMKDFMDGRVMPKIDSYRINHNHDYFLSQKAIEFRIEQAKALTKAFFVENWEQSSKEKFVQKAIEYTLEPNSTILIDKSLKENEVDVYTKEEQEKIEQVNSSIIKFVKQYSNELFEEYRKEMKENVVNKEETKLYRYYTKRPVDLETVPKGFKSFENYDYYKYNNDAGRQVYGFVEYDRELSEAEIKEFELLKPNPFREIKIEPTKENGLKETYVLSGRVGAMEGTTLSNYDIPIQNGNKINKFNAFDSFEEAIRFVENGFKPLSQEKNEPNIPLMPVVSDEEAKKQIIKEEVKLPFSIINNVEKGRVNIKFEQKISDKKFNSILKELKSAGWRFSSFNKQWYPVGKAVEKSESFIRELQEKYSKAEETITYATASFEEFSQTLTESEIQKTPYDGIKFFDRNYKEIDEFVAYFNRNLDVFGKDVEPIDEKIAETIFESLQVERVGTLDSRTIRLGLDSSDNLILLNKEKSEINTRQISLKELFSLAKETLEKSKNELEKSIEDLSKNKNKEDYLKIIENLFQTAKKNNIELINKMDVIYEAYIKEPAQQTKKISKVKPLKVGDSIGDEVVQDVFFMSKGVYQATLIKDMNKGAFAPGTFFVLDKNIVEKLNPELHQFLEDKGEFSIFETSCRTTPHIIKDLIDKKLCPPRDNEYYQQLVLHTEKNPLKYEVLYPVTKYNFKNKLKQVYEIDKHVNNDVLNMGKQLLSLATEGDKKEISKWLKDDVGCEDEKSLKNMFTNWVSEKEIKQEKKKDGYPPRGE